MGNGAGVVSEEKYTPQLNESIAGTSTDGIQLAPISETAPADVTAHLQIGSSDAKRSTPSKSKAIHASDSSNRSTSSQVSSSPAKVKKAGTDGSIRSTHSHQSHQTERSHASRHGGVKEQKKSHTTPTPVAAAAPVVPAQSAVPASTTNASLPQSRDTLTRSDSNGDLSYAASLEGGGSLEGDGDGDEDFSDESEADVEPIGVLLQFIPYYGQGDPSNDSIVRATLSSLSVEDIDSKDEYGNTLLLLACQYRCEDLVRIMLNKGADPNGVNSSGACCLHFACYRESASYSVAKLLLQNGANPDVAESSFGCTPLHYCAGTGDVDFCKLLLNYGAQIDARDFYNYTCVDYAREAGTPEVTHFLQIRLDKAVKQSNFRADATPERDSVHNWEMHTDPDTAGSRYYIHINSGECVWEAELKTRFPDEKAYFKEQENLSMEADPKDDSGRPGSALAKPGSPGAKMGAKPGSSHHPGADRDRHPSRGNEQWLLSQAFNTRLVAFFGQHDPSRLLEVDALVKENKGGKEKELLSKLYAQYKVAEDDDFRTFTKKFNDAAKSASGLSATTAGADSGGKSPGGKGHSSSSHSLKDGNNTKSSSIGYGGGTCGNSPHHANSSSNHSLHSHHSQSHHSQSHSHPHNKSSGNLGSLNGELPSAHLNKIVLNADEKVSDLHLIDPQVLQRVSAEAHNETRDKYEAQLEEERRAWRASLADKEAEIARIQTELESLMRARASIEDDNKSLNSKLDRLKMQGGEALQEAENELKTSQAANADLKANVAVLQSELSFERDKLKSLELSLSSLTEGHEETLAKERQAAEERAQAQKAKDAQHSQEIHELESKAKNNELRLKGEFNQNKQEWARTEKELKDAYDNMKHAKEREIDALERELAERKAQYAQEKAAYESRISDLNRSNEQALRRMEEAEQTALSLQQEVAEARIVQKYNAQLHKDLLREQLARKKLHNDMEDMKGRIRVYVRVRPFSKAERDKGCTEAVLRDGKMTVLVKGIGSPDAKKVYDFDQVFGGTDGNTQADVFRDTKHLIMSVVDGYNVCIFAYGQTGAGKSFTMIGAADIGSCMSPSGDFDELAGITPRAVSELFRLLNERTAQVEYSVEVQMFQLYRDGLDDLLMDKSGAGGKKKKGQDVDELRPATLKVTLAEHSKTGLVNVEGATTMVAETPGDVMQIFAKGSARRTTASTQMNAESSRSHLICSLVVRLKNRRSGNESVGKLTLVDLAGSERVDKSGAAGEVLKEAQSINKSLSALGDVIAALTTGQNHVPYRNHPLTMLMSDSIGGNAKTLMFVNTSPADYNNAESNSSLQFASRCKNVTNAVQQGPGVQAQQVNALKKELQRMKKTGVAGRAGLGRPG